MQRVSACVCFFTNCCSHTMLAICNATNYKMRAVLEFLYLLISNLLYSCKHTRSLAITPYQLWVTLPILQRVMLPLKGKHHFVLHPSRL